MGDSPELTRLKRSRAGHRGVVTKREARYSELIVDPALIGRDEIKEMKELMVSLKKTQSTLQLKDLEIEKEVEDADLEEEIERTEQFHFQLDRAVAMIQETVDEWEAARAPPPVPPPPPLSRPPAASFARADSIKLPKIELPVFSGSYTEWSSFIDLFDASVHSKASLTAAEKLNYLKSATRGDANRLIRNLSITTANYPVARAILKDRYGNKRVIVRNHLDNLFNFPANKTESASGMRKLLECFQENLGALEIQGCKVEEWDPIILHLITSKMDPESRKHWELDHPGTDLQSVKDLCGFIDSRARALETVGQSAASSSTSSGSRHVDKRPGSQFPKTQSYMTAADPLQCPLCSKAHQLYACQQFWDKDQKQKHDIVQSSRLCYNCLQTGHGVSKCPSQRSCRQCGKRHHSMLHRSTGVENSHSSATQKSLVQESASKVEPPPTTALATFNTFQANIGSKTVLLPTCGVTLLDKHFNHVKARALFDGGSQANFITERLVQKLGLPKSKSKVGIKSLGATVAQVSNGVVNVTIVVPNREPILAEMLVLSKISDKLPSTKIDISKYQHIANHDLADESFWIPGEVDLLLGIEVYNEAMLAQKVKDGTLTLAKSIFGWTVSGAAVSTDSGQEDPSMVCNFTTQHQAVDISQFWRMEEVPSSYAKSVAGDVVLTSEEIACEKHFDETTKPREDGMLAVSLPFKIPEARLGEGKVPCVRRFYNLESKLVRNPKLYEQYRNFIREFIDLGHLEVIPEEELDKPCHQTYYLPHHCIEKESTTTKLRVVFDASAKTSNNLSLNDLLMVGPKLQDDLFDHLIRFRFHQVALTGDITKMYRQIALNKPDKDYHRLFWRDSPDEPVKTLRMTRVTYGIASSCYHSVRALQEAAKGQDVPPEVSETILRDFYIDDLLTGACSVPAAQSLQQNLHSVLKSKHFVLRKFCCNAPEIVASLPKELREDEHAFTLGDRDHTVKTLGIKWKPIEDVFIFTVDHVDSDLLGRKITKRVMLSDISKVFDPLGWLVPVTLKLKLTMQSSWIRGIDWDEVLPDDIAQAFLAWREQLPILKKVKIKRKILTSEPRGFELHVFCDASQLAYAACIYVRVLGTSEHAEISLLTAKSKVAPLKMVTIPRLELCAALLGSKLLSAVLSALKRLNLVPVKVYGWTDSTVVLSWLQEIPRQWNVFVANRVSQIQDILPSENWFHVGTKDNPADVASRGVEASAFVEHDLWWHGPTWLPALEMPKQPVLRQVDDDRRKSPIIALHVSEPRESSGSDAILNLEAQGSLAKATAVLSAVFRFISLLRKASRGLNRLPESRSEVIRFLVKAEQAKYFAAEIKVLQQGKPISATSKLLPLYPFLDDGILKVGGRLASGEHLSESLKYPMILPKESRLSYLLVADIHRKYLHAGAQTCLSELRRSFWIISAKSLIRQYIHSCVKCFRYNSRATTPLMADLPRERITPSKPFTHTGVDFGGPFLIRESKGAKSAPKSKAYLALFVCFATKAVHLELVSSLSAPACIAALRRFASRRGAPSHMYSDNGTNFIGSRRELSTLQAILERKFGQDSMPSAASELGSTWSTIPPSSPHWGGLWEAGIKSAKTHLRKIMGNNVLTFEELATIFCDIEAILNSRPMVQLSDDVKDLRALTPGMLVTGKEVLYVPLATPSLISGDIPLDSQVHPQRRWEFLQNLTSNFWKRWTKEYLTTLQTRPKWRKELPNLEPGDLVLVTDERLPPLQWPLGRILNTYTGNDKVCRVAKVQTSKGIYNRPVVKLRRLPMSPSVTAPSPATSQ